MSPQPQTADTLIHPGWIVPVLPRGVVLENYSIALTGDRITALLPRGEADAIAARGYWNYPDMLCCRGW